MTAHIVPSQCSIKVWIEPVAAKWPTAQQSEADAHVIPVRLLYELLGFADGKIAHEVPSQCSINVSAVLFG